MENKQFVLNELNKQFDLLFEILDTTSKEKLVFGSEQKWSPMMQLDHLIRSTRAVNRGLMVPKFLFPFITGKIKRNPYSYIEIVEKYSNKLAEGAKATGGYIPKERKINDFPKLLIEMKREQKRMIENLNNWTETDLDKNVMPHPIIGKISVREMLFFTIYHIEHHAKSIQKIG
jgi:hypothetical protein